jgi:FAD/FMN-containing dehydrogenase
MTNLVERTLGRLNEQKPGRLSMPGEQSYAAATAIWAKPFALAPRAIFSCQTAEDVQAAIHAAGECDLALSVRGGGHDWAGRALCDGLVINLAGMNTVVVSADRRSARISGGARASDVVAVTDPLGIAAVTGSCGGVGMVGLTLGGGYGPLIGRFGLALDNLIAADVVLADGRYVTATRDINEDLFWALRGGGGNFGVVTTIQQRLHDLPSICSGMLVFPFAEAQSVLERCAELAASAPDELTVQLGFVVGSNGTPSVLVVPTWSGLPHDAERQLARFFSLGTPMAGTLDVMPYGGGLAIFDPHVIYGQRVIMETVWLPALDSGCIDALTQAIETAVSPGCAIFTHEFKGAASRVPEISTAFGLRRDHLLVEILASFVDQSNLIDEQKHRQWVQTTLMALSISALPGGYPNLLADGNPIRATQSYGRNAPRLIEVKRQYDPDNVFSATPLPK